ncbi:hypothetical protein SMICM17S_12049 [Streptomyces microflavus]
MAHAEPLGLVQRTGHLAAVAYDDERHAALGGDRLVGGEDEVGVLGVRPGDHAHLDELDARAHQQVRDGGGVLGAELDPRHVCGVPQRGVGYTGRPLQFLGSLCCHFLCSPFPKVAVFR